jgi:hypothetical protein
MTRRPSSRISLSSWEGNIARHFHRYPEILHRTVDLTLLLVGQSKEICRSK